MMTNPNPSPTLEPLLVVLADFYRVLVRDAWPEPGTPPPELDRSLINEAVTALLLMKSQSPRLNYNAIMMALEWKPAKVLDFFCRLEPGLQSFKVIEWHPLALAYIVELQAELETASTKGGPDVLSTLPRHEGKA